VEQLWEVGEKVLIFCFQINNAQRLHDIITQCIGAKLRLRLKRCLGGEAQLKALRGRLSGRTRDLVTLGLDRILWSFLWAQKEKCPFTPADFELRDQDFGHSHRSHLHLA
jgi:hypothetical protein